MSGRVPAEAVKSAKFLHPGSSVGFVGSCNGGNLVVKLFVERKSCFTDEHGGDQSFDCSLLVAGVLRVEVVDNLM